MSAFLSAFSLLALTAIADARVTFEYSEVLQKGDLYDNDAPFNCDDGCTVYVDKTFNYFQVAQNGIPIATFEDIFGNSSFIAEGFELPAGENYTLERQFGNFEEFVFYVVSATAPNYRSPVSILEVGDNLWAHSKDRFHTILTSENNLIFYGFTGTFTPGFPKIYAAGSASPQLSTISVTSPVVTVDFGSEGEHSVSTTTTEGEIWLKTPHSSTVYMSEGFVGCPSVGDQSYSKITNAINDEFTLDASSLDISASYSYLKATEAVKLRVNGDVLDFSNADSSNFTAHYDAATFDVELAWTRGSIQSSWVLQLDFGASEVITTTTTTTTVKSTTSEAAKATEQSSSTTSKPTTSITPEMTTSSSRVMSLLASMIVVAFVL